MAEQKLKPTEQSVSRFLGDIADETRRKDCVTLVNVMKRVTRAEPKIWAGGLIGFGNYHYKYASGHEGDCFIAGFANRKSALTVYITAGVQRFPKLLAKLGKHKTGKGCLYIRNLDDVDMSVLEELLAQSLKVTAETYKS